MINFLRKNKQSKAFLKIFSCLMIFSVLLSCFIISSSAADDSMIGTWVFKDTPSFDDAIFNVPCTFDFTVAGQTYNSIILLDSNYGVSAYFIDYYSDSSVLTAYSSVPVVWLPGGWEYEEYKILDILTEPNDEWFKQWLRGNATKQGSSDSDSPFSFFDVLDNISSYFYSSFNVVSGLFFDSASGSLTLFGALSVIGLSLGLCFLFISLLLKFLYLGG